MENALNLYVNLGYFNITSYVIFQSTYVCFINSSVNILFLSDDLMGRLWFSFFPIVGFKHKVFILLDLHIFLLFEQASYSIFNFSFICKLHAYKITIDFCMLCPDTLQIILFLEICIGLFDSLVRYFLKFPVSTFNKLSQTENLKEHKFILLWFWRVRTGKWAKAMFQDQKPPRSFVSCVPICIWMAHTLN